MINLRYHIVSITAVFLALGIGITMGSTFLGKATLDQIDTNVRNTRTEIRNVRSENAELRKQVDLANQRDADLTDEATPQLFAGSLTDVPVVVMSVGGVDQDSLDNLQTAFTTSGATFDGTLVATDKMRLEGNDAAELATLLDTNVTSPTALRKVLSRQLSAELLAAAEVPGDTGPSAPTTTTTRPAGTTLPGATTTVPRPTTTTTIPTTNEPPALLHKLIDAGFFDYEPARNGAAADDLLTQVGYRYVFVTGARADLSDEELLLPLLREMTTDAPSPVVVASAATGDNAEAERTLALAPLIDDDVIGDRITTVDNLESFNGLAAVALGVRDLGNDRRGHYGFGDGASSQLPPFRS